ncbi:1005_t:CDS:1, partial [Gigaspora rosea]
RKAIFSDGSKFKIFGTDGREFVLERSKLPLLPQHVKPMVRFGEICKDMGCFSVYGVGNDCRIEGTMNKELHHEILKDASETDCNAKSLYILQSYF